MKVLLAHSFLYPEHGGDSIYTLRLRELLADRGHEVALWGMRDPRNPRHPHAAHEAPPIDYRGLHGRRSPLGGLRVVSRAIYSAPARRALARLLDEWRPDVAHLQSIHYHLTTSILHELHARRVPVVWTQHNLALVCCNFMLDRGAICERCKPNRFYSPLLTRCKRGSLAASAVGALQLSYDHLSGVYDKVACFVAISRHYRAKLVEFGFEPRRIRVVPNFHEPPPDCADGGAGEDYVLYFGRLSPEKGVATLIAAMGRLARPTRLLVVGDGPQREELRSLAARTAPGRIELLGRRDGAELDRLIRGSRLTVTPSVWYENFPNTVVESFVRGRAVVGASIGGIPELVREGRTGWLFAPGDALDLARVLERALGDPERERLGRDARAFALGELDPERHYQRLLAIYGEVRGAGAGRARPAPCATAEPEPLVEALR